MTDLDAIYQQVDECISRIYELGIREGRKTTSNKDKSKDLVHSKKYNKGLVSAWSFMQQLVSLTERERCMIFGTENIEEILSEYTIYEALQSFESYISAISMKPDEDNRCINCKWNTSVSKHFCCEICLKYIEEQIEQSRKAKPSKQSEEDRILEEKLSSITKKLQEAERGGCEC